MKIREDLVDLTEKYQKDQDILLFQKKEKNKSLGGDSGTEKSMILQHVSKIIMGALFWIQHIF